MVFFQRLSTLSLHHSLQHCNSSLTVLNLLRNVTWVLYLTFSFCLLIPLFESCSQYSGRRHLISLQSVLSMTSVWPFGKLDKTPQACEHGWTWILITSVEINIPEQEEAVSMLSYRRRRSNVLWPVSVTKSILMRKSTSVDEGLYIGSTISSNWFPNSQKYS